MFAIELALEEGLKRVIQDILQNIANNQVTGYGKLIKFHTSQDLNKFLNFPSAP